MPISLCSQEAAPAAKWLFIPCARKLPHIPANTSPEPAVDRNGEDSLARSVIFFGDEIKSLNKEFRKKNKVTDVLSFSDEIASGDIAIADSYILNKNNTINSQSFFMLVSHGLLHLFGYSHYDRQSRSNMRFLENMFMKFIGLKPVHED